ncbi:hypothetical protein SAMN04487897_1742 [Paenibacillus sp. yr247]|uniref:hypothetical protein n=1 Tax=Paenibacillus sp. yr247 TaxID=1761880 RepID=UPI00088E4BF5|nr:hypothetical protein [Paenibacillus sp. yr247]SDP30588.1 hypothetical protein SAMN04487897_1742 [Paenibacillus sp. yr247]
MKLIRSISSDGIKYIDENGIEKYVDFIECNENWINYRKRKENLSDERIESVRGKDKCIGQRDSGTSPRFIEFFTRPFTRFEFEGPNSEHDYAQLRDKIISSGWTTLDLS